MVSSIRRTLFSTVDHIIIYYNNEEAMMKQRDNPNASTILNK